MVELENVFSRSLEKHEPLSNTYKIGIINNKLINDLSKHFIPIE